MITKLKLVWSNKEKLILMARKRQPRNIDKYAKKSKLWKRKLSVLMSTTKQVCAQDSVQTNSLSQDT